MKGNKGKNVGTRHANHMIAIGIILIILVILTGSFLLMKPYFSHMYDSSSYSEKGKYPTMANYNGNDSEMPATGPYDDTPAPNYWFSKDCDKDADTCIRIHAVPNSLEYVDGGVVLDKYTGESVSILNANHLRDDDKSILFGVKQTPESEYALAGWTFHDASNQGHSWLLDKYGSIYYDELDTETVHDVYAQQIPTSCFKSLAKDGHCELGEYQGKSLPNGYKSSAGVKGIHGVGLRSTSSNGGKLIQLNHSENENGVMGIGLPSTESLDDKTVSIPGANTTNSGALIGYVVPEVISKSDGVIITRDMLYTPGKDVDLDARNLILDSDGDVVVTAVFADVPDHILGLIDPSKGANSTNSNLLGYYFNTSAY